MNSLEQRCRFKWRPARIPACAIKHFAGILAAIVALPVSHQVVAGLLWDADFARLVNHGVAEAIGDIQRVLICERGAQIVAEGVQRVDSAILSPLGTCIGRGPAKYRSSSGFGKRLRASLLRLLFSAFVPRSCKPSRRNANGFTSVMPLSMATAKIVESALRYFFNVFRTTPCVAATCSSQRRPVWRSRQLGERGEAGLLGWCAQCEVGEAFGESSVLVDCFVAACARLQVRPNRVRIMQCLAAWSVAFVIERPGGLGGFGLNA